MCEGIGQAYVSKESKGDQKAGEEKEVHGPVPEGRHEWQEEEECV